MSKANAAVAPLLMYDLKLVRGLASLRCTAGVYLHLSFELALYRLSAEEPALKIARVVVAVKLGRVSGDSKNHWAGNITTNGSRL